MRKVLGLPATEVPVTTSASTEYVAGPQTIFQPSSFSVGVMFSQIGSLEGDPLEKVDNIKIVIRFMNMAIWVFKKDLSGGFELS